MSLYPVKTAELLSLDVVMETMGKIMLTITVNSKVVGNL